MAVYKEQDHRALVLLITRIHSILINPKLIETFDSNHGCFLYQAMYSIVSTLVE